MAEPALTLDFEWKSRRFYDAAKGLGYLANDLEKKFDGAAEIISKELRGWLEDVAEALELRHSGAWPGGTGEKTMSKRSGWMLEQIKDSITVTGNTIPTIEGTISVPYERRIHENGGVIKAKNVKYLTVPLPAALDSKGIPLKKKAKDWQNTFVIKTKAGKLIIVQKDGIQLKYLYVLKPDVYIPPRLGLWDTMWAGRTLLTDRLADALLKNLLGGST